MDIEKWHNDTLGAKVVESLKKNNFDAVYFSDKDTAAQYVLNSILPGMEVGIGGSVTLNQLGLPDKAQEKGAIVLNHNLPHLTPEEKFDLRRKQLLCDVFLCSANGITLDGYLVNIDATGNRTGAMTFGPKKVFVIAGVNKISSNVHAAFQRIQTHAGPKNNKRLNIPNPCTVSGVCTDCQGKTRICNIFSIIKRKPSATDITVVIIGEELGF
ncbi:MAG: lactate utilization protein [Bacillota bacterium]